MNTIDVGDLSILLVEPSVTQSKVIQNHLLAEGVTKIEAASSGNEALEIMMKYLPDLVVSSMYLPDMCATELITAMRNEERLEGIPFMLVSSENRFNVLDPVRQSGVVAILPKPFCHNDLSRALRITIELIDPEEISLGLYDVASLRILVVDDSSTARKHVSRILKGMGVEHIVEAVNGQEGVDALSNGEFDLIVTDYNMPEMDGGELVEWVRQEIGNTFIPILMITSEANESTLAHIQQAGVSAICNKPFDPENIREIIYRVLEAA